MLSLLVILGLGMFFSNSAEAKEQVNFSIASQNLGSALTEFALQANTTLLFPYNLGSDQISKPVFGDLSILEAIDTLLVGTHFYALINKDGSISIIKKERLPPESKESNNFTSAYEQERIVKEETERIAIVGTRSSPHTSTQSAVPLDILAYEQLNRHGAKDMLSVLSDLLPSLNVNDQPINDAAAFIRPANLRGLAPDHSLILINGKRHHRSAVITFYGGQISDGAQGVDIATIPAIALKQVEVLRDGAAAQYGSDAIAGVMNFVLKNSDSGGLVELLYGQYYEGEQSSQISANIGFPLLEDGFINLSMEYKNMTPTSRAVQRDDAQGLIDAGNFYVSSLAQTWGSPEVKDDIKLFANVGFGLNEFSDAYLFAKYARRNVEGGFYYRHPHSRIGVNYGGIEAADVDGDGSITVDNSGQANEGYGLLLVADLNLDGSSNCPTNIRTGDEIVNGETVVWGNVLNNPLYVSQVQQNSNCFAFNELYPGGFTPKFGGLIIDKMIAMGTKGKFFGDTNYDVSLNIGSNQIDFNIRNTINASLGPESPTQFKPGKYIQSETSLNIDINQTIETALVDDFFWAAGFEYRYESFEGVAGDIASYQVGDLARQGFGIGANGFPGLSKEFDGKNGRNSIALYLDSETYLTENLMLEAAVRHENFTDFGRTTIGKLSSRLQVSDSFAVRGALASGFKAPTIGQSNVRSLTTAFTSSGLIDRVILPPSNSVAMQKGATTLKPEQSNSLSFGLIAEFDRNTSMTLDYFRIRLRDRISTTSGIALTQTDIDNLLAQGVNDASTFSEMSFFTNDFTTNTQGIDFVARHSFSYLKGENTVSFLANWTNTKVKNVRAFDLDSGTYIKINPSQIQAFIEKGFTVNISELRVRMLEDNLPAYRWSINAEHRRDKYQFSASLNYFSDTFEDHLDSGYIIENIGSEYSLDVEFSTRIFERGVINLGAKNILDERPDKNTLYDTEIAGAKYPTTSALGMNGGYFYIKVQFNL